MSGRLHGRGSGPWGLHSLWDHLLLGSPMETQGVSAAAAPQFDSTTTCPALRTFLGKRGWEGCTSSAPRTMGAARTVTELLCVHVCASCFTCKLSCPLHSIPARQVLLLAPFHRREHKGTERESNALSHTASKWDSWDLNLLEMLVGTTRAWLVPSVGSCPRRGPSLNSPTDVPSLQHMRRQSGDPVEDTAGIPVLPLPV